jgi:hypothetical protein
MSAQALRPTGGIPDANPESSPVAAAEARTVAPLRVSGLEQMACSRLLTVSADTLLVELAELLSSAEICVAVVCDAAGPPLSIITDAVLVRHLGRPQGGLNTAVGSAHRLFAATVWFEALTGSQGALVRLRRLRLRGQHGELWARRMGGPTASVSAWLRRSPR